jgi:hypothetical protein
MSLTSLKVQGMQYMVIARERELERYVKCERKKRERDLGIEEGSDVETRDGRMTRVCCRGVRCWGGGEGWGEGKKEGTEASSRILERAVEREEMKNKLAKDGQNATTQTPRYTWRRDSPGR